MKRKLALFGGALAFASFGFAPAPALAQGGVVIIQCDSETCYMISCASMPNVNGEGWTGHGCGVIDSWPREREVSGG